MLPGYFAAGSFLVFTGVGVTVQVVKLAKRAAASRAGHLPRVEVCEGLHPVREMWSYSAYFCFALSGLTRTYLDLFIVLSRTPVIILSTVILWYLAEFSGGKARRYFATAVAADLLFLALIFVTAAGVPVHETALPRIVDFALMFVSVFLFYGKQLQAFTMYRLRQSRAVSLTRELGIVIKDITGIWYALTVGAELFWVQATHTLSAVSSGTIAVVKLIVERGRRNVELKQ